MECALIEELAEAANRFLGSLDPAQRARAVYPFADEAKRTEWYYTPNARPGIPMVELDATQRQNARRLLHASLSEGGYNTAATIMGIEAVLDPVEHWRTNAFLGYDQRVPTVNRDPNMYFVAVFGEPGAERWGWSFGGHHVSVHITVAGNSVAASPCFLGAHPAVAPLQPGFFLEPLAAERKLGLELLHSLDSAQRAKALLLGKPPFDIVTANRPAVADGDMPRKPWEIIGIHPYRERWEREHAHLPIEAEALEPLRLTAQPKGLAASEMKPSQQEALRELTSVYLQRVRPEAAYEHIERAAAGIGAFHFAWAGGDNAMTAHYYRIQGPRLLIEYDSPFDDGSHIHSVWRDPEGDFGMDLLAAHYAEAHR